MLAGWYRCSAWTGLVISFPYPVEPLPFGPPVRSEPGVCCQSRWQGHVGGFSRSSRAIRVDRLEGRGHGYMEELGDDKRVQDVSLVLLAMAAGTEYVCLRRGLRPFFLICFIIIKQFEFAFSRPLSFTATFILKVTSCYFHGTNTIRLTANTIRLVTNNLTHSSYKRPQTYLRLTMAGSAADALPPPIVWLHDP